MSYLSTFNHEDNVVNNWIKNIINQIGENTLIKAQYFMMSGISLNDCKLIEYAISLDKSVVDSPVSNYILTIVDSILSPVTGFKLYENEISQDQEYQNEQESASPN